MKLKPYEAYKYSGVDLLGVVPDEWVVKPLKFISDVRLSNIDKHTVEGESPVLLCNYVDVYKNERIDTNIEFMPATASDEQIRRLGLSVGDVIITKDSEDPRDIGIPTYVAETNDKLVCGYHLALIRPNDETSGEFLYYLLKSRYAAASFENEANGITRYAIGKYSIGNLDIPIPSLQVQSSIVGFLDRETTKIDTLITKQEKLIELLQENRQAVISNAVTKGLNPDVPMKDSGVEWIGMVPENWIVSGITKYLESVIDYRGKTPNKVQDGIFLVTARNIKNGKIDYEISKEFIDINDYDSIMSRGQPVIGDVLFTTEAPLGQVAIVDRVDIALAQRIIKFRTIPSRLSSDFLKLWIEGNSCQFNLNVLATGSTALGIKGSKVGQVMMLLPPLKEQLEVVGFIKNETAKIDALIEKAKRSIELSKEHRSALISSAVTGKIDVREAA